MFSGLGKVPRLVMYYCRLYSVNVRSIQYGKECLQSFSHCIMGTDQGLTLWSFSCSPSQHQHPPPPPENVQIPCFFFFFANKKAHFFSTHLSRSTDGAMEFSSMRFSRLVSRPSLGIWFWSLVSELPSFFRLAQTWLEKKWTMIQK